MRRDALRLRDVPWSVLFVALVLTATGMIFLHSASRTSPRFAGLEVRQAVFLLGALGAFAITLCIPIAWIRAVATPAYALCVLMLGGLFVFGSLKNGAIRWYDLGAFALQPSEFAKVGVILVLAKYLRFRAGAPASEGLFVPLVIAAVPALMVMRQPDLGSSLVFFPVMLAMSYAAGASGRQIVLLLVAAMVLAFVSWPLLHEYQRERVRMWWTQETLTPQQLRGSAWQMVQALIAIGAGGFTGFGYGLGPQNRFDFLPYRSGDYLFAVVAEETGLLGAAAVASGFVLLVGGLLATAIATRERFSRLVVVGVAALLGVQAFVHMGVCTSLLPATGLPLPFFSSGGSSLLAAYAALGLALNVASRHEPVLARDGFE